MAATITEREREVLRMNETRDDSEAGIRLRIRKVFREHFGDDSCTPANDEDVMMAGLDSLSTVSVMSMMSEEFQVRFSAAILFDYPSISALANAIYTGRGVVEHLPVETLPAKGHRPPVLAAFTQLVAGAPPAPPVTRPKLQDVYTREKRYDTDYSRYDRAIDGMKCVLIPSNTVWVGDGRFGRAGLPNEKPCHKVRMSSFLIDVEPVCAGAYARFLNCVWPDEEQVADWIGLRPGDVRERHMPLHRNSDGFWEVKASFSPKWPMIMVSWYGANAYSLWVNGRDWQGYRDASQSCLPTEAQWEYAARGVRPCNFPWGDTPASADLLVFCPDEQKLDPEMNLEDFPLQPVNAELGVSPFGARGMAGNVWQWCRDTYDPEFYKTREAWSPDAWNPATKGLKSERGGSWVGPASVARCSYRRGRAAGAKGRCLGFRCVGELREGEASAVSSTRTGAQEDAASTEANSADGDNASISSARSS